MTKATLAGGLNGLTSKSKGLEGGMMHTRKANVRWMKSIEFIQNADE